MKRTKVCLALILASIVLLSARPGPARPDRPAGRGGALALVRIPKTATLPLGTLVRLGIDVRQDLATCLLALADRDDMTMLRRSGIRFSVLDRNAPRPEYLLVETGLPGALDSLRAAGRAVAVEAGTAVFWTERGSAAAEVPAGLPSKVLPARSVLPYLRSRPAAAAAAPVAAVQDPLVESIVSLVSSSSLAADVQTLQDLQTRYASTTNCESAGDSLYASFSALGLDDVHFESFTFSSGYTSRNVVAEKTGESFPGDFYIICAHYDSTSPSATRQTLAPGADDNASGAAAVLGAARALAGYPLDYSVRFVAFSAEEWGLWGSRAYADAARARGERILGVINLDMIAYANAVPEDLQIIVNDSSAWLADLFAIAGAQYGVVTTARMIDPSIIYSDHSPFWDNGYPALLAIEDYPLNNPYYHQTTDTLDRLNLDFFTAAARGATGLLAGLAQPIRDGYPAAPARLTAAWETYRSLFNTLAAVNLEWDAQADAAGYNVYRTTTSHLGYVKVNDEPIVGTSFSDTGAVSGGEYYYVLTAVGPTGLESNRSRENAWRSAAAVPAAAASSGRTIRPAGPRGIR
ncbi:MAG TPA: M28 family peptidase [Candidatus Aminicenantes bacterium]|nr:M28 family peptidase [Candidatus Aminicenantes bacterium]HRY65454.1 M28 family peptidase [Candidatus Aminicenantes bacterium]HRZ72078.1 M28 family peptidase [Candidatus Aminicenantes bacterium]